MNAMNKLIKVPKLSKDNPEKSIKLKKLLDLEEDVGESKPAKKITNYNETIFFEKKVEAEEKNKILSDIGNKKDFNELTDNNMTVTKLINNVITSKLTNDKGNSSEINVNLNINHNYYNSNYNYVLNSGTGNNPNVKEEEKKEEGESVNFFGK
jgi:hypothetical protein